MGFEIGIKDIIDILLVGSMMYWFFKLLKRSGAASLFWGILIVLVVWSMVSIVFQLELTGAIFDRIISVGAIALIILFQDQLRAFIYRLGSRFNIEQWFKRAKRTDTEVALAAAEIVHACKHMSETHTGALIVLCGQANLKEIADTGEQINARISTRLIENIFFKNTPLHDGALLIGEGKLLSAACILPVSKNQEIPQHYGLRHRAALGLTEKTTATAIVVSEETGHISVAVGESIREVSLEELLKEATRAM